MQEQPILSQQETEFQSGNQAHFSESKLTPQEQIEANRLINEALPDTEAVKIIEQATLSPQVEMSTPERAEVDLSPEERIDRIGLNLAVIRKLSQSDFDLTA